jgi:hypothetical protein
VETGVCLLERHARVEHYDVLVASLPGTVQSA